MGYSNNIKPSLKNNCYSPVDGCGNNYEEKYYYNGMYIDLCGLPIEEYMKNPFCCGGNNNDGDNDGVKPINEIMVKSFIDENNVIYYQAFSKFAVTSNLKIIVSSTSDIVTELDLFAGDTFSKAEIGETLNFMGVTINIDEDDNYRYIAISESEKISYEIYYNTVLLKEIDTFSNDFGLITIDYNTSSDVKFVIPGTDFNYNELEDIDEVESFFNENQYCFLIYLPKEIYENKKYVITSYDGMDNTKKFVFHKEFSINNNTYVCIVEKAVDDIAAFVPLYKEEHVFEYKLTINK